MAKKPSCDDLEGDDMRQNYNYYQLADGTCEMIDLSGTGT